MGTLISDAWELAWRLFKVDGVASSGVSNPNKVDILPIGQLIQGQIDAIRLLVASGFQVKDPARTAAVTNISVAAMNAGDTIGGVVVADGDRVFLTAQTDEEENGLYTIAVAAPSPRSSDANSSDEIRGMAAFVTEGTEAGKVYVVSATTATIIVGTTDIPVYLFLDMSSLNAAIALKADQTEVDALTATVTVIEANTKDKNARTEGLSADWVWAVYNERSRGVEIGQRYDEPVPFMGSNVVPLGELGYSAEWFQAIYDPVTKEVITGLRWDGSQFPDSGADPNLIVYDVGASPSRIVRANYNGTDLLVASGDGDQFGATAAQLEARWLANAAGTLRVLRDSVDTATLVTQDRIVSIPSYGQSLSVGRTNGTVINSSATSPGKALMFAPGVRYFGAEHTPAYVNVQLDRLTLDPITDAVETVSGNGGETGWARMAASLTSTGAIYEDDAVLVSACGIGGMGYDDLKKGTLPYFNLIQSICRGKLVADLLGKDYIVPAVVFIHGEHDYLESAATYQAWLEELQEDLDTDIKAITGQADEVLLVLDQMSSWTVSLSGTATSGVPVAQIRAALDNPTKIVCVGPKYQYTYIDGQHLDPTGFADNGERIARALEAGAAWRPLYPISAVRAGAVITVTFDVPEGNLAIDTTLVTNPGNNGVEFAQTGGAGETISSVAVASATTLTVTLSGTPAGTAQKLRFGITGTPNTGGGYNSGPRTNIRDSATLVSDEGTALYNWAAHFEIDVT